MVNFKNGHSHQDALARALQEDSRNLAREGQLGQAIIEKISQMQHFLRQKEIDIPEIRTGPQKEVDKRAQFKRDVAENKRQMKNQYESS